METVIIAQNPWLMMIVVGSGRDNMTNADKIRQMTDNELAGIIMCPYGSDGMTCLNNEMGLGCIDCSLDWLRAERVEENE